MSVRAIKARSVGRLELLSWLNKLLESDYSKVEHLGDGIAYAQIFDAIYPKKVDLHKLNFNAKDEDARVKNFTVLENALAKCGVKRNVNARRLAKCKFADNCEFLQWCYAYLHSNYADANINYRVCICVFVYFICVVRVKNYMSIIPACSAHWRNTFLPC